MALRAKTVPGTGLSFFWPAGASGLVSLCKYLHGGIIDGPTHFEVERRSTSGHIRAKNDTECDLESGGKKRGDTM